MIIKDNCGIIIQARLGSTRLPNKVLKEFYEGNSILFLLMERLYKKFGNNLVIATTENSLDNLIEEFAIKNGYNYFRGSEENVLERFINASKQFNFKKIIRICADNPFLDIDSIDLLIKQLNQGYDYASYSTSLNIPTIKTHYGFWCEGTTLEALEKINVLTKEKIYHEHVTNYIYNNNSLFKIKLNQIPEYIENSKIRLTVDTENDFSLLKNIYFRTLEKYSKITPDNVLSILNKSDYNFMQKEIMNNEK